MASLLLTNTILDQMPIARAGIIFNSAVYGIGLSKIKDIS